MGHSNHDQSYDRWNTIFFLVYGIEAMLPPELKIGSARTDCFNKNDQEERRLDDINFFEERHNQALIWSTIYQQAMRRYHSRKVQPRSLAVGDLLLRKLQS